MLLAETAALDFIPYYREVSLHLAAEGDGSES